jgi:hypothetical protein
MWARAARQWSPALTGDGAPTPGAPRFGSKEARKNGVHCLVLSPERLDGVVLLEDHFFIIRSVGRVVWCHLLIPKNTPPSAGADAAQRLGKYLLDKVLYPRSSWLGLILDVRKGPSVFGPITRELNSKLFVAAERARKPLAVVTIGQGAQHSQFCELAAQAPQFAVVTSVVDEAVDWMTMPH